MTAVPGERSFYIVEYSDEMLPCDTTLEGWATWLSEPREGEGRDEAASDGDQFPATAIRWAEDIVATRFDGTWSFSREPEGSFLAVRYAQGMGWSPDNIVWGEDMAAALRQWFVENDRDCDDTEYVAVGHDEPKMLLTYRADPPRLLVGETIQ